MLSHVRRSVLSSRNRSNQVMELLSSLNAPADLCIMLLTELSATLVALTTDAWKADKGRNTHDRSYEKECLVRADPPSEPRLLAKDISN